MTTEAEIEVLELQAKERQRLAANYQKRGRSEKGVSPTDFRGSMVLPRP